LLDHRHVGTGQQPAIERRDRRAELERLNERHAARRATTGDRENYPGLLQLCRSAWFLDAASCPLQSDHPTDIGLVRSVYAALHMMPSSSSQLRSIMAHQAIGAQMATLDERLGGLDAITAVVDSFVAPLRRR
jgi:hypothetical protein